MLTPTYMDKVPNALLKLYRELEYKILSDIGEQLIFSYEKGKTTISYDNLQMVETMLNKGYSMQELSKEIAKIQKVQPKMVHDMIYGAAKQSYKNDDYFFTLAKQPLKRFEDNKPLLNLIKIHEQRTQQDFYNLSRTLGLEGNSLQGYYQKELTKSIIEIQSTAYTSQKAINKAINNLANSGLQTIDYKNGRSMSVESSVRSNVITSLNQMTGQLSLKNAEDMEQELMELSAHSGARPTHEVWQGQIVSLTGNGNGKYLSLADIGYGEVDGFLGKNCRHNWYPHFENISVPAWVSDDLENINLEPFEYENKIYTEYEGSQKLRAMERSIRTQKKKIILIDSSKDINWKNKEKERLDKKINKYLDFANKGKLKPKLYRTYVANE